MIVEATSFLDPDELTMRRVMGRFLTGVAIITTRDRDGGSHGMTINSMTSVSLSPPILMVALSSGARTGEALITSPCFAISILGVKQEAVARRFAIRGGERFDEGEFDLTESGLPVVRGAVSQADCRVVARNDVGDHQVFFGQVTRCRDREEDPLGFRGGTFGRFKDFGHEHRPWRS